LSIRHIPQDASDAADKNSGVSVYSQNYTWVGHIGSGDKHV